MKTRLSGGRSRGIAVALLVALGPVLAPSLVRADAYDAAMAQGAAMKEKALDAGDPANWDEALGSFLEADALRATKESKYEIAFAAAHLKEDDLAVEAYEQSIALGLEGSGKAKAEAFVAAHAASMARLTVTGPAGAKVVVARRPRGVLPLAHPIVVFAGVTHLHVTVGGKSADVDVTTGEGQSTTVDVGGELAAPSASASSANIPPPVASSAPPLASATMVPRPPSPSTGPDEGAGARKLGLALVLGGAGLAVVGGIFYGVAAKTVDARRELLRDSCDDIAPEGDRCLSTASYKANDAQSDSDALATWKPIRTVSAVAFSVGVGVALVGVVRLVSAPSGGKESPTSGAVTPTVSISGSGGFFGLSGGF